MQGLRIGAADDPLEAEADRIAHRVLHAPPSAPDPLDPLASNTPARPGASRNHLGHTSGLLGSGRPLPDSERAFFEPRLSWSLADVRIHDEPRASQAAASMNARAFTLGNDVAFAHGQWRPGTPDGRQLLAHELAHIQQARSGADPGAIRRAMNFEMQLKNNRIFASDGEGREPKPLPRKFGPGDSLVEDRSGLRLESETQGQLEFETKWERQWAKIKPQIEKAQAMVFRMKTGPQIDEYKGFPVRPYPFATKHLRQGHWKVPKRKHGEHFETNVETGAIADRPLTDLHDLVIVEADETWTAYIQTSESFKLDQFESFFQSYESEEYDKSEDPNASPKTDKLFTNGKERLLSAAKKITDILIQTEQPKRRSSHHAERSRSHPSGETPAPYANLQNFIALVLSYLRRAKHPVFSTAGSPLKYAFSTMSKTHFGSIFQTLLLPDEQALFKAFVRDADTLFLKQQGQAKENPFFEKGHGKTETAQAFNPTIGEWLDSIAQGRDLLSSKESPGVSTAMGGRSVKADKLISSEVRVTDKNSVPATDWLTYTKARFDDAMRRQKKPKKETKKKE